MREPKRPDRWLAALLVGLVLVLVGCGSGEQQVPEGVEVQDKDGLHGSGLVDKYDAPTEPLTDTDGEPYSLAADTQKPLTLVFFGYTNCPDICQMVMSNIASSLTRLDDSEREQVDVAFVTTDPARDDEKQLRTYLDRFDPGFVGLTGKLPDLVETGKAFGVFMEREPKLPTGGYNVSHTTHVFAVDANDQVPAIWSADTSASDLAEDISELLGRQS